MVDEAVGSVTDNDVSRIEEDMQAAGVQATVGKTDASRNDVIHITGARC